MFGGIYRRASLLAVRPVHVDLMDFGGPGFYGRATDIQADSARVQVSSRVTNNHRTSQRAVVETAVVDADGSVVASSSETTAPIPPGAVSIEAHDTPEGGGAAPRDFNRQLCTRSVRRFLNVDRGRGGRRGRGPERGADSDHEAVPVHGVRQRGVRYPRVVPRCGALRHEVRRSGTQRRHRPD